MKNQLYFVYIMASENNRVLYTGVTSNLEARVFQHSSKADKKCFTARYNCTKLVWFGETDSREAAITYEKKIKAGSRKNKERLIKKINPDWRNLSLGWD